MATQTETKITTWMCDSGYHRPTELDRDRSGEFTYNGYCAGTVRPVDSREIVDCECDCHN